MKTVEKVKGNTLFNDFTMLCKFLWHIIKELKRTILQQLAKHPVLTMT